MVVEVKVDDGRVFRGETVRDVAVEMWKERFTKTEIARCIGRSRQWVGYLLNREGYKGRHSYPELNDPNTFLESDYEIAKRLHVAESRVRSARLRLGIKHVKPVDINGRRKELCKFLFGTTYLPGPRFLDWTCEISRKVLTPKQQKQLLDFYLHGFQDGVGRYRLYRHYARKKLREKIEVDVNRLLEEGVLCQK